MARKGLGQWMGQELLAWYDRHGRDLPWRAKPGAAADPYGVWLSEIMLQQTTVAAVKGYYGTFLTRWPAVGDLARASLDDVLRAWAGLGYYARARNLHACAKIVADEMDGKFPDTVLALRQLPGIGPYTAAAIAAIAFNRRAAAIDGNAERVIARLYAIATPLPQAKTEIRARVEPLVPEDRPGDFAQALMDLGATICTPRAPDCPNCPWAEHCAGRRHPEKFPAKQPKVAVPVRYGVAFWIARDDGAVLLRRRPEKGLLGGMMEVPSTEWGPKKPRNAEAQAPVMAKWHKVKGSVSHTFTHFHLELAVWRAAGTFDIGGGEYRWVTKAALGAEALPTLMRKVVRLVNG